MVYTSDKDSFRNNFMFALLFIQLLLIIVITAMIFLNRFLPVDTATTTIVNRTSSTRSLETTDDIVHFHARNSKHDKFLYDGTFYVLPLGNIQLSTKGVDTTVEPYTVVTNGYCSFETEDSYDYTFGKNLIKAVYHNKDQIYLVVPVSYMHDWVSKRLVSVKENHYVLDNNLVISGGLHRKQETSTRVPEIISLPVPIRGEIPSVLVE